MMTIRFFVLLNFAKSIDPGNDQQEQKEQHKINLIMKIIEPEINDVYLRLRNVKRMQENIHGESFDNQSNEGAEYKKKTKDVNDKLKKLF